MIRRAPNARAGPASPAFDEATVGLRPIDAGDLEMLRSWRNTERVRSRMFDTGTISPEGQDAWWQRRAHDPGYRQYLLSYAGEPLGTISFTFDARAVRATCGYYVGAEDAPPRTGTLLLYVGLCEAYRVLGLRDVICEIVPENEPSLRLVRRFGFIPTDRAAAGFDRRPRGESFLTFVLTLDAFEANEPLVRELLFVQGGPGARR